MNDEELILNVANKKTIPCLTCKNGMHNFLAYYCLEYDKKPDEVYFESKPCPNYIPLKEEK